MRKSLKYGLLAWFVFAILVCILGEDFAAAAMCAFAGSQVADAMGDADEDEERNA